MNNAELLMIENITNNFIWATLTATLLMTFKSWISSGTTFLIENLFFKKVIIHDKVGVMYLKNYLDSSAIRSPFNVPVYRFFTYFVKSANEYRSIPMLSDDLSTGTIELFWHGKHPIVISGTKVEKKDNSDGDELTGYPVYIPRWMKNFDELLIESEQYHNTFNSGDSGYYFTSDNFSVNVHTGTLGTNNNSVRVETDHFAEKVSETSRGKRCKILGYDEDDLMDDMDDKSRISRDNYFMDESLKEHFRYAENWIRYKEWYNSHGVPWRAGICIEGPPGTGKSKFAALIASELKLRLDIVALSTFKNGEFHKLWHKIQNNAQDGAVVLMEDFHTIFDGREQLNKNHDALQFGTLLDCISGAENSEGIFLILTTNDISMLDWALGGPHGRPPEEDQALKGISSRPGRIDKIIRMGNGGIDQRRMMIHKYLGDLVEESELQKLIVETEGYTMAQVQYTCTEIAYKVLGQKFLEGNTK